MMVKGQSKNRKTVGAVSDVYYVVAVVFRALEAGGCDVVDRRVFGCQDWCKQGNLAVSGKVLIV
jgi:hypothetical protein